jgi:hypothetical protein
LQRFSTSPRGNENVRLENCSALVERGDGGEPLNVLERLQPPAGRKRRLGAALKRYLKTGSKTNTFGIRPAVEDRLAKFKAIEELATIEGNCGRDVVTIERLKKGVSVHPHRFRIGETDPLTIRWNQVFAECSPKAVECLSKGVSGVGFGHIAPEQVDKLLPPGLPSNGQIDQQRQRLSWTQSPKGCPVLGRDSREPHQSEFEADWRFRGSVQLLGLKHGYRELKSSGNRTL